MNRYWDVPEKERAEMTGEQVESFIAVELMEKGVIQPKQPGLEDYSEIDVARETVYGIEYGGKYGKNASDLVFADKESAAAFIMLKPMFTDSEYYGSEHKRWAKPCEDMEVVSRQLYDKDSLTAAQSALKRNGEIKKRNKELTDEYAAGMKAVRDASKGVWEDYYELREQKERHEKVIATHEEYVKLSGGNETIAAGFLAKAYDNESVIEAFKWFDKEPPVLEPEEQPVEI